MDAARDELPEWTSGGIHLGAVKEGSSHTEAGEAFGGMGDGSLDGGEACATRTLSEPYPMLTPLCHPTRHPRPYTSN
jgi:hypothetical protein